MGLFDAFSYKGKRALVVGGATGMGAAAAEVLVDAGADVVVMDRVEADIDGTSFIQVDLADKASIGAAVDECGGPVHAHLACAGVADGTPGLEKINFIGHRHMIDRMLDADMIPRGSAIGFISSAAGMGWEAALPWLNEYLAITDFDEASRWAVDNGQDHYMASKQAICAYVAREAMGLLRRGIRINAIMPGPTDTPLAQANADLWLSFAADYREEVGTQPSTPLEQAYPLVFLCSDAATAINGMTIISDAGYTNSGLSGSFPNATGVVEFLMGRVDPDELANL
jgi:NAD(P)-dependent dehydrogenase (short-subunit alcohol dehydrogenase family)